jgi:hypothetical protein
MGIEPVTETPAQFMDFAKKDLARNTELLKAVNFEKV